MRTLAFGDLHGHYDETKKLVELVKPDNHDTLIFIGDYIDRGKQSFEVIEYMLELKQQYNCIFLKGNHEEMFADYLSGINNELYIYNGGDATIESYSDHGFDISGINNELYIYNGGDATIESYSDHGFDISQYTHYTDRVFPETHMDFFSNLKLYHEDDKYIFVHAGLFPSEIPLEKQSQNMLLWVREPFISSNQSFGKKVIFGHTPFRESLNMENKIGIDTGIAYGGKLTCVILPDEKFVSVSYEKK
jgi:serine/threonine protein phosphatase 1